MLGQTLGPLVLHIHNTSDYRQYCDVRNTAQHCRLELFQDSDFAGDLEDSKLTSGGILCISGTRTFVPISWMWKKQTSVSHSSIKSEVISLDAGLRMDGLPALGLWDLVIEIVHSSLDQPDQGNLFDNEQSRKRTNSRPKKHPNRGDLQLINVDDVTTNAELSHFSALPYILRTTKQQSR